MHTSRLLASFLLAAASGFSSVSCATPATTSPLPSSSQAASDGAHDGPDAIPQPPPPRWSKKPAVERLSIVHVGDTEAGMLADPVSGIGGIARTQALLAALARARPHSIVVHAGDTMIPAPELAVDVDVRGRKRSALLAANDLLGVSVAAVGNHDFDLGESFLADAIKGASFAFVSSTLDVRGGPLAPLLVDATPWLTDIPGHLAHRGLVCAGTLRFEGSARTCDGVVVGIVGTTPMALRSISRGASPQVAVPATIAGQVAALQPHVDAVVAAGAHVVLLLSHLQSVEREPELVAAGLTGVDVIVSGGGENRLAAPAHRLLAGDGPDAVCARWSAPCYPHVVTARDGAPVAIVATGADMHYIGNLLVDIDDEGHLTGFDTASRSWPVDETSMLEARAEVVRDTLALEQDVRDALAPLTTPAFASSVWLEGTRELVRNRETNLGDLSADALVDAARRKRPDVIAALRNAGGIRAPIGVVDAATGRHAGKTVTRLDIKNALRFDSPVVVVDVSHAELRATLESALIGAGTARGHFPQVSSEVELQWLPTGREQVPHIVDGKAKGVSCPGARVWRLVLHPEGRAAVVVVDAGVLTTPEARVSLATIDYLAQGGDGWFALAPPRAVQAVGVGEQAALTDFVARLESEGRWHGGEGYVDGTATRIVPRGDVAAPAPQPSPTCPAP